MKFRYLRQSIQPEINRMRILRLFGKCQEWKHWKGVRNTDLQNFSKLPPFTFLRILITKDLTELRPSCETQYMGECIL